MRCLDEVNKGDIVHVVLFDEHTLCALIRCVSAPAACGQTWGYQIWTHILTPSRVRIHLACRCGVSVNVQLVRAVHVDSMQAV